MEFHSPTKVETFYNWLKTVMTENTKRQKIQKEVNFNQDIISKIIDYLEFSDILSFCIVNHEIYDFIFKIAETKEVLYEPFTLKQAFSEKIYEIKSEKDLELFHKKVHIIDYLKIKSEGFCLNLEFKKNHIKKILLEVCYIEWDKCLEFLSKLPEIVEIELTGEYNDSTLTTSIKPFEKVKKLSFNDVCEFDNYEFLNQSTFLFPNLQHFIIFYDVSNIPDDNLNLLDFKYLKSIWIESSQPGCPPSYNNLTDEYISSLINNLKFLEEITVLHSTLTGSLFENLQENFTLKSISLHIDMYEDSDDLGSHFTNYFHNLKEIHLDGFLSINLWDSVSEYCPKIEYIDIEIDKEEKLSFNEEMMKKVVKNKYPNLKKIYLPLYQQQYLTFQKQMPNLNIIDKDKNRYFLHGYIQEENSNSDKDEGQDD